MWAVLKAEKLHYYLQQQYFTSKPVQIDWFIVESAGQLFIFCSMFAVPVLYLWPVIY